jgi:hypothetical protein
MYPKMIIRGGNSLMPCADWDKMVVSLSDGLEQLGNMQSGRKLQLILPFGGIKRSETCADSHI